MELQVQMPHTTPSQIIAQWGKRDKEGKTTLHWQLATGDVLIAALWTCVIAVTFVTKLSVASCQLQVAWPGSSLLLLFLWRFLWSNETNELFGSLCSQTEVSFVYCNNNKCNNSCNWPQSGKRLCHHQLPVGIELFKTAWGVFTSNCSHCFCK